MPRIAAVIPTYNRSKFLGDCLKSLCEQNLDPEQFEICVVNNNSSDNTREIFAEVRGRYPHIKLYLVDEPKIGLSNARNKGIASVGSPLIAFGDDDAIMPSDWLSRYAARFDELGEEVGKIGGGIDPIWGAPRPAWLSDPMLSMLSAATGHGATAKFCDYPIAECNSCYRRDILIGIGGFPAHLGRSGNNLISNEGVIDWIIRAKGYKLFYDPAIIIRHFIHADRLTPKWFRRRYFWQGVSDYAGIAYLNKHGLGFTDQIKPVLPAGESDWAFVNDDNATDNMGLNLTKLRWVGFMLSMSGIIQIDQ